MSSVALPIFASYGDVKLSESTDGCVKLCSFNGYKFFIFIKPLSAEKSLDIVFENSSIIFLNCIKAAEKIAVKADSIIYFETPQAKEYTFCVKRHIIPSSEVRIQALFLLGVIERSPDKILKALIELCGEKPKTDALRYLNIPLLPPRTFDLSEEKVQFSGGIRFVS